MLEGLAAIDWKKLSHAYGAAGDVPRLIRALASPDPEKWVGALSGLYDTLCHQTCTVYEATGPAVPFLIELLGHRPVRCRGRLLQFLGDAARVTSYQAGDDEFDDDEFDDDEDEDDPEFAQERAAELENARQTREAIWNGLDVFLELLTDLDKRLRIIVPYTLGQLVRFPPEEIPAGLRRRQPLRLIKQRLAKQLEEEPSELVQASVIFGLGRLMPHVPGVKRLLERQAKDRTASMLLRFSAALNLAADAAALTGPTLDVLLEVLKDPAGMRRLFDSGEPGMEGKHHPLAKAYRQAGAPLGGEDGTGFDPDDVEKDEDFTFPWNDDLTTSAILKRFAGADAGIIDRVVPVVAPGLDKANGFTVDAVVAPILRLLFAGRKITLKTRRKDLTEAEAGALRRLYDNLNLWATDSGNVTGVFREFGLTHERKDWRRLLGLRDAPLTPARIEEMLAAMAPGQQYDWDRPTIKRLNLRQIGTGAFLPHLGQYPDLEDLDLSAIPLTDADLTHLAGFRKLRRLQLPNTAVTDAGVETLTTLKALEELNLGLTQITDAAFALLKKLPKLKVLMLWKSPVSDEAIQKFRKARPKCLVYR
ncbi:hypothetical protein [Zavarzinella formosa]|uniref:hypothetical protein n=1 Tax=Zavarzinella formosa TaxID=360055 RepID=UPI0003097863|nr:hypothetical protein [Zavarzinella formosa]